MTLIKYCLIHLICAVDISVCMSAHQEYQDHHSEEEDTDLYEKIACTERDDKAGGGMDKRRRKLFNCGMNDVIILTQFCISGPLRAAVTTIFKCLTLLFPASRPSVTHSSSSAGDADQKRVRTKLMKFLMKRPTLQSVKEKGYIRGSFKQP